MPMSIEELERSYRQAYRRLCIGIAIVYGTIVLAVLGGVVGNAGTRWTLGAGQAELASRDAAMSEPMQPARRIRTVKND
jgi:sulfite exporter TauE/SafE